MITMLFSGVRDTFERPAARAARQHPLGHEGLTCGSEQVPVQPRLQEPSRGLCLRRAGPHVPSCFYKVTF